jgi:hypothetical protein
MSKSVQCKNCKAIYYFDEKKWESFICEICKTFIKKEKENENLRRSKRRIIFKS